MIKQTSKWQDPKFDTIIDVRTPSEFTEDHIVGAMNCPVLEQEEHATIGSIYKNKDSFSAKVAGASMVAKNIGKHIENSLCNFDGSWQPLVYCWRGGMRSRSMAIVLQEIGWRPWMLSGGYKAYRNEILNFIPKISKEIRPILLSGKTGAGKTLLLNEIEKRGGNVLNLESIAKHRGSLLGSIPNQTQPTQKFFESLLADKLGAFSKGDIVFIEAESSKIGNLHIPNGLWKAMQHAPIVHINLPAKIRAEFLVRHYPDLIETPERFLKIFKQARARLGDEVIILWQKLIEKKAWETLALSMIEKYYDPAYNISGIRRNQHNLGVIEFKGPIEKNIKKLSEKILVLGETYYNP